MASRTSYPATESAGDVLTTTNFNKLPGGCIGYIFKTSAQTGISSETDLTTLTVTVTVNTSRLIRVEGWVAVQQITSAGTPSLRLKESSTQLQQANVALNASDTGYLYVVTVLSPSSGSHTYKLTLSTTTATVNTVCSSTFPGILMVTDIGPSF